MPISIRADFTASTGTEGRFIRGMVASGTTVYAGTDQGVYRSMDSGATWAKSGTGGSAVQVMSIDASGNTVIAGLYGIGVTVSTDGGATWKGSRDGFDVPDVFSVAIRGTELLAGTVDGLYRSQDGGTSWTLHVAGSYPAIQVTGTDAFALEVGGALYHSPAAGQPFVMTIEDFTTSNPFISLASLASEGDRFYAGGDRGAVFRSEDRGVTWTRVGANSAVKIPFSSIVVALVPAQGFLLACTSTRGVYLSGDRGDKWVHAGQGLPIGNTRGLMVIGGKILVGTFEGVYTRPLTDLPSSIRRAPALPRTAVVHSPIQVLRLLALRADGKSMPQAIMGRP